MGSIAIFDLYKNEIDVSHNASAFKALLVTVYTPLDLCLGDRSYPSRLVSLVTFIPYRFVSLVFAQKNFKDNSLHLWFHYYCSYSYTYIIYKRKHLYIYIKIFSLMHYTNADIIGRSADTYNCIFWPNASGSLCYFREEKRFPLYFRMFWRCKPPFRAQTTIVLLFFSTVKLLGRLHR